MSTNTESMKASKLGSVRSYLQIAWIFSILGIVVYALAFVWELWTYLTWSSIFGGYFGGYFAGGALITGIVFIVLAVLAVLVYMRVSKMYKAAKSGDIATLKALSNVMWGIIGLFVLGLTGIMLLIANGPIQEL